LLRGLHHESAVASHHVGLLSKWLLLSKLLLLLSELLLLLVELGHHSWDLLLGRGTILRRVSILHDWLAIHGVILHHECVCLVDWLLSGKVRLSGNHLTVSGGRGHLATHWVTHLRWRHHWRGHGGHMLQPELGVISDYAPLNSAV